MPGDLIFQPAAPREQLLVVTAPAGGDHLDIRFRRVLKELAAPRTFDFIEYSGQPSFLPFDPNFTVSSLRANLVLRWEYLPGSTMYFVWTNDKFDYAQTGTMDFGENVRTLFNDHPDNIFSLKITYWWSP